MQTLDSGNGSGAWAASFYNYATDGHGMELGIGNGTSANSAFEIQNSAENRTFFKVAQNGTSSFDGKSASTHRLHQLHFQYIMKNLILLQLILMVI